MSNFIQSFALGDTGNTKLLLQQWVEQMNPTSDIVDDATLIVASNKIKVGPVIHRFENFRKSFTFFETAGLTSPDVNLISLGAGAMIHAVKVNVRTLFSGTAIATAVLNVGTTPGTPTEFITAADMEVATTTTAAGTYLATVSNMFLTENASTNILANLVTTGANTDALDQGEVDVWIWYSIADSEL